jgi:DNA-binding response OmpR family regulator
MLRQSRSLMMPSDYVKGFICLQTSSKSGKRVLVVDDHELIANTLVMVLTAEGFHAVAAYDAQHALNLLQSERFDLLLSDVMPGMTGVELAIDVTRRRVVHKVLLMSGVSERTDLLENARKLGYSFDILAKPIYPTEVIERINSLLP